MLRFIIIFIGFTLSQFNAVADVINVQFVPEIYGRNVSGLLRCQISNGGAPRPVSVSIVVKERVAGVVCVIKTPVFTLGSGSQPIPLRVAGSTAVQFSDGRSGRLLRQTNAFPSGDYEYCYTINLINSDQPPVEQCFDYTLAPFADLSLLDPFDGDSTCNRRPVLTWQPLLPAIPGAAYQLVLTKVKNGQSPTEAMNYNLPFINQRAIMTPILVYPPVQRELSNGKYAWQVSAYKDQVILNRSEIWTFTVGCPDEPDPVVKQVDHSYRDIVDLSKGNDYLVTDSIRFSIVNSNAEERLRYTLVTLPERGRPVRGLPKIKLSRGLNLITIGIPKSRRNAGKDFLLRVWLPNGTLQQLRIRYEKE